MAKAKPGKSKPRTSKSAQSVAKRQKRTEMAPVKRADSKQQQLVAMLQRPAGATIDELAKKLEWQSHTVRGAIAGVLKKRLKLKVNSDKEEGRGRVYRIPA